MYKSLKNIGKNIHTSKLYSVLSIIAAVLLATLILASCNDQGSNANAKMKNDQIKIESIDWKVENAVINNYRRVCFSFDNNSQYKIISLEANFKMKEGTTEEQVTSAGKSLIAMGKYPSTILNGTLTAEPSQITDPGQTSVKDELLLGISYIEDMELYELTEPDIFTISYLGPDEKIHKEYYNFKNKSYSLDDEVIDPNQWSDCELAQKIPRPEGLIISSIKEGSTLQIDIIKLTTQQYNEYIAKCSNMGYTAKRQTDTSYEANSSDGKTNIRTSYTPSLGKLTIYVKNN